MGKDERNQTLKELGLQIYENAKMHGFYDEITDILNNPYIPDNQKLFIHRLWYSNRLMLIVSELAEGLEGIRSNNYSIEPKSGGLGEEIADAQIRLADLATDLNLDLDDAVKQKMEFNKNRPPRRKL